MTDIYQAPAGSMAQKTKPYDGQGSVENGIAGNYDFQIGAIISEAWNRTSGNKGTLWLALLLYMIVMTVFSFALQFILGLLGLTYHEGDPIGKMIIYQLASQLQLFVTLPLIVGFNMMGVKIAVDAPVEVTEIFAYFKKVLVLVGTSILYYLMIIIGLCLLVLPGIYLMVAYLLAFPLVAEKNMGPWEALETSRKAITHHWFKFVGLYLLLALIMLVSAIPLGIGLIWTLPMSTILVGVVYRTVFGYSGEVNATADKLA